MRRNFLRIDENKKIIYRNLAVVAVPIAVQSLIASSLNLVDNLMVGALGEEALGAVGAGMQIFFVSWIVTIGFSAGCSTFAAQFWGACDIRNIRKTTGFAAAVCFAAGVLFFIAGYFFPVRVMRIFTDIPVTVELGAQYVKSGAPALLLAPLSVVLQMSLKVTQQTKIPMYVSIASFSLNTFMNWVLIYGHFGLPAMGVRGAAIATVISRIIEFILCVYFVFIRKNILNGNIREFFGWSRQLIKRVTKNSVPTMANEALWSLAVTMYVAAYARIGVTQYAAYQASDTIDRLFVMAAFSLGDAALILVGQKLGEKRFDEAFRLAGIILRIACVLGVILGALLILSAGLLVGLFSFSRAGAHNALLLLVVYGVTMPVDVCTACLVTGILRSGGDTRFAMLTDAGTIWLIGVPLAWISTAVFHWPVYIALLLTRTEEVVKFIILMRRFIQKKWVNNVINNID